MRDSLFSDAGWFFFVAWSVVIGWVSVAAFGRDLLPASSQVDSDARSRQADAPRLQTRAR